MNKKGTFIKARFGKGAGPRHMKYTADDMTEIIDLPKTVTIPLTQHAGQPAELAVEKGQRVYVGTVIGKSTGFISADTHSSLSGVVTDIPEITFYDGSKRTAVVVEADGEQTADPAIAPPKIDTLDDFLKAVRSSGLVGLGGAGFPTHVKLAPNEKPLDLLLVNGAECEPYITSDYRTMMEDAEHLIFGVREILRFSRLPRAVIAVESNKPLAIAHLRELTKDDGDIEIKTLKSIYPQGAEKVLIATVTGRAVPSGGLPADAGAVVLNVSTVSTLSKFLKTGMPLVERRVTVAGGAMKRTGNFFVPVGMMISDIFHQFGCTSDALERIVVGGPMMGIALFSDQFPVIKTTNAVLALTAAETSELPDHNCIHCARCIECCPVRLSPVEIDVAFSLKNANTLKKLSVIECIECGCCSYVCPAGRPLTQTMCLGKDVVRKAGGAK